MTEYVLLHEKVINFNIRKIADFVGISLAKVVSDFELHKQWVNLDLLIGNSLVHKSLIRTLVRFLRRNTNDCISKTECIEDFRDTRKCINFAKDFLITDYLKVGKNEKN